MATENKFTIDDAFESDEDDKIRMYGSVAESTPLRTSRSASLRDVHLNEPSERMTEDSHKKLISTPRRKEKPSLSVTESTVSLNTSQSDDTTVDTKTFLQESWWKHPKIRENWKVVIASFVLLILGVVLLVVGIIVEAAHLEGVQSFVFFIAGAICVIPGAYHVVYIYCAVRGKRGFSLHNLPVFK